MSLLVYVDQAYAVPAIFLEDEFEKADYVLVGKVSISAIISEPEILENKTTDGLAKYMIDVVEFHKGDWPNSFVALGDFLREPHPMAYETYPFEVNDIVEIYLKESKEPKHSAPYVIMVAPSRLMFNCDEAVKLGIPTDWKYNCYPEKLGNPLRDESFNSNTDEYRLDFILEHCEKHGALDYVGYLRYLNDTHLIDLDTCQWDKRTNSGISMDRTVYPDSRNSLELALDDFNNWMREQLSLIIEHLQNFSIIPYVYGSISFDKSSYTWTDEINIRITEHGIDADGTSVKIYTDNHELNNYKLSKTGNGLYTGKIILTGFLHDVNGDGKPDTVPRTIGNGPNNGFLEAQNDDELKIYVKFGDGDTISKSVKIMWNAGLIGFDLPEYQLEQFAKLQVTDPDMNLNPDTLDKIQLHVFSDSDKAGLLVDAIETMETSGMFETVVSFSSYDVSSGDRLFVLIGDSIYAKYTDYTLPSPYSIDDDSDLVVTSKIVDENTLFPIPSSANMVWELSSYFGTDDGMIQVIDPDMNLNSDRIDTFPIYVWSESDNDGIDVVLVETDESTGIFQGTVTFTTSDESSGNRLRVSPGDIVHAKYLDGMQSTFTVLDDSIITSNVEIKQSISFPLKQKTSGITLDNIACKVGLEKIFKSNDSVICVKPLTAEKLVQRSQMFTKILG